MRSYWGVFWIDCSSTEASDHGYAELGSLFGKGSSPAAGKYWLSRIRSPWLLFLDNVDNHQIDLETLLPSGNNGHIVITTRNPNLADHATAGIIRLTQMDPEEAIDLLLNSAYPRDRLLRVQGRSTAGQIAEVLGFLAIAVHQAGSTIRRNIYTLDKYLTSYLGHRDRLLPHTSISLVDTEIVTTWEIPFQKVEAMVSTPHKDAVAVMHILACFHHESIPEVILQAPWYRGNDLMVPETELPTIFSIKVADQAAAEARLRRALSILYEYSIIEFDAVRSLCSLHPVVHAWFRDRMRSRGEIAYWLRCTAFILACLGQNWLSKSPTLPVHSLLPHLDSYLHLARGAEPSIFNGGVAALQAENVATLYEMAGHWIPALKLLQPVIEYRARTSGWSNTDTIRVKRIASLCQWNLFQVKDVLQLQCEILLARWVRRPSLMSWRHPIRPTHTDYLLALSDLCQTLWLAGQRNISKTVGERAVDGLRLALGIDHPLTVDATFHLGRTLRHTGHLEEAHKMLTLVYKARRMKLGPTHLDTLMIKNELAMSLCSRKKALALAERWVSEVLEARKRLLGEEHAYTLWSVNDLAKVYMVRGRPEDATTILEDAIPAVIRTLGGKHVGMQMTKGNLARAYAQCRRWEDAAHSLEEIIPDIDNDHPDWTRSMVGCARIKIRLAQFSEAEEMCMEVIARLSKPKATARQMIQHSFNEPDWFMLATRWAAWFAADSPSVKQYMLTTAGLLAVIYHYQEDALGKLTALRQRFPDFEENVMGRDFELT